MARRASPRSAAPRQALCAALDGTVLSLRAAHRVPPARAAWSRRVATRGVAGDRARRAAERLDQEELASEMARRNIFMPGSITDSVRANPKAAAFVLEKAREA